MPLTSPLRVVLADDDPLVRRALRVALSRANIAVVAEATDGDEAFAATEREDPDAVLMDVDMPGVDGVTATLRISRAHPRVRVLMIGTSDDPAIGMLALRAGANGFLTKEAGPERLGRGLHEVARGDAVLSPGLALGLVERLRALPESSCGLRPVRSDLTTREWQVLDLMCSGASTDGIATELVLSVATVRSHIKHVLQKLGAHSRAEAIEMADQLRDTSPAGDPAGTHLDEVAFRRRFERLRDRGGDGG